MPTPKSSLEMKTLSIYPPNGSFCSFQISCYASSDVWMVYYGTYAFDLAGIKKDPGTPPKNVPLVLRECQLQTDVQHAHSIKKE